jgi:hypothetical protein
MAGNETSVPPPAMALIAPATVAAASAITSPTGEEAGTRDDHRTRRAGVWLSAIDGGEEALLAALDQEQIRTSRTG